ncbi:hypothetical protein C7212DRAFT_360752 [Tuber magnatum]|uniref:Uncharacterized protein n=1 Tax=Tuber magnatum TaxID=42249 RepID=A0A317SZH7_9PEZI|nr:hypothetical protein C7212DRAFT_360752 [Tuber magnatum]
MHRNSPQSPGSPLKTASPPPPSTAPLSAAHRPPHTQDSIDAGSTTTDASHTSPEPRQAHSSPSASQIISNIATSASSLLTSIAHQDSASANATLASLSGSSGKVQSSSTAPSSSPSVLADPSHPALSNASSAATSAGFKSQPLSGPTSDIEFKLFSADRTVPTCQHYNRSHSPDSVKNDGEAVIDLLSQPLYVPDPSPSHLSRIDAAHPAVVEFAACDDPVDFLSNTSEYSEDIWGDLAGLFRRAKGEIKGKRKEPQSPTTMNRLREVWGHLRSSKL